MLSGIGPKEHLEKVKLPVIQNLPVGENLQDHALFVGMFLKLKKLGATFLKPTDIIYEMSKYLYDR